MRFSRSLITTIKDSKDGTHEGLASVEFLTRGGFVLQVASGLYDFLPLGKMMLDNIQNIIKEELNNAGCVEVTLAFATPAELWQKSGRLEKYGKELLRFKDRKEQDFVLSPTCEELMVDLAKAKVTSYRQLPLNIYQIHLKFRDEIRPRFGLLRGREFWMKDGYSFHADEEDMLREFALMEATYKRIFERLGLEYKVVEADSGAIGGSGSKEFMVLANAGEDTLVVCKSCEYGANIEAATRKPKKHKDEPCTKEEVHTPNTKTIEELSLFFGLPTEKFVKAVAKKAIHKESEEAVLFFIAGCDELEETKALNACGALALEDLSAEGLAKAGLSAGFMGPDGIGAKAFFDNELAGRVGLICGVNKTDYHTKGFEIPKDAAFKDLVAVQVGDGCPCCGASLEHAKGIEVGHIFQLRDRYSAPMEAKFLDKNGKTQNFVMGTYGIGVSRLIAAIVEQCSDEKGCILPNSVAPYQIDIVVSNIKDEAQKEHAEKLYEELKAEGFRVLLDDRDERYGHKMGDFELIGFPCAVIVGKNIVNGKVEVVDRATLSKKELEFDECIGYLKGVLQ
jgi:prolyl-tRNA synthetase